MSFSHLPPIEANILLVDDRPENLLALEAILEPLGDTLVRANSGLEALAQVLRHDFAVILLDVQMPGMDGFETAALIKDREKSRHIPIIFVTAISKDASYVFKGYSAGAVDYIPKPFDPDILRSKVSVFVDLYRKGEQIQQQSELLRQSDQRENERLAAEREHKLTRRHMEALAISQARLSEFKTTLDATLDSVFIFDPQTLRFSYINQGALRLFGYDCETMLQMTLLDLEQDFDEPAFRQMISVLIEGTEESLTFQKMAKRCDGHEIPVELFLQFVAPEGEKPRFVAIVRDITERKKWEENLIAARDEAERQRESAQRANRAKSEFISGVSHELRTPLNAIIGFSKLLLNPRVGPLNEDQGMYTQDIVQSAEHLLQLINDILDLSKIEAGKASLESSSFSLADLLRESLAVVRESASLKNLNLEVAIAPEVESMDLIEADRRKVKQILLNLLSNAVKFTPEGGAIILGARCESANSEGASPESAKPKKKSAKNGATKCDFSDDRSRVVIWVEDSGVGIAPENQARVWGAFEQVDSSYARRQQGTGLGLALTKRLVELHGGTITLKSTPEKGSTFSFTLPLHAHVETSETDNKAELVAAGEAAGERN